KCVKDRIDGFNGTCVHPYAALLVRAHAGIRVVVPGHRHATTRKVCSNRVVCEFHSPEEVSFRKVYLLRWCFGLLFKGGVAAGCNSHQQHRATHHNSKQFQNTVHKLVQINAVESQFILTRVSGTVEDTEREHYVAALELRQVIDE